MKKITSIKTRITMWYTTVMFILIAFVLVLVGTISYGLSIDNVEKDVVLRVTQVTEKLGTRQFDVFYAVDNNEEFKNVSIHKTDGEYIAGQYAYDITNIKFKEGPPRREVVDGREYIVYDVKKPAPPGKPMMGLWIRGVESVNSTVILGRSAFSIFIIIIPLILILTAIGGYYITKKAFMPINDILSTANVICTENDLKQRIQIAPNARMDELNRLSVTLNTMLDKIEDLMLQEKQFTSDASHELRTPLSVILAQSEYLYDIADTEKEKELSKNIIDKTNQVSKLVSRLLLMSRIDSNRQKINTEKIDLSLLVDIAVENLTDIAESKNVNLITDIKEDTVIYGDEALLGSVLENLISNGIKYSCKSGSVTVTSEQTDDITSIIVKDEGVGISKEHIEKIWGRFYRVDNVRNDEYGSNGLGLSMVKSIVELHGGTVSVESEINKGSVFTVKLPSFNKNN